MSVPRRMFLRTAATGRVELWQEPVAALRGSLSLRGGEIAAPDRNVAGVETLADDCGGAYFLDVAITMLGAKQAAVVVRALHNSSVGTLIGYDAEKGELFIDRTRSGEVDFSSDFPGVHGAPYEVEEGGSLNLRVLVDEGSVEVFADGGRVALTDIIFPAEHTKSIALVAKEGAAKFSGITITPLKPYRKGCPEPTATCRLRQ